MMSTAIKRGVLIGLLSGAIAGALFGLFVHALDSDLGRDVAQAVGLATKDENSPDFPIPARPRAAAAFMAGGLLALLAAWVVGKAVKTARPLPVVMDQGFFKELAGKLAGVGLLVILAGLCGVLTAGPAGARPLFQVVLMVAVAAAIGGGLYGAVVGWLEQRRVRRRGGE